MKNKKYLSRNKYMLKGPLKRKGYDWWLHSFTGYHKVTGKPKSFFIEYFVMNPSRNLKSPVFGQTDGERLFDSGAAGTVKPSYVMIKAGAWGENAKQIHNFFSTDDLEIGTKELSLRVGNCTLSEDSLIGVVNLSSSEAAAEMFPRHIPTAASNTAYFLIVFLLFISFSTNDCCKTHLFTCVLQQPALLIHLKHHACMLIPVI